MTANARGGGVGGRWSALRLLSHSMLALEHSSCLHALLDDLWRKKETSVDIRPQLSLLTLFK